MVIIIKMESAVDLSTRRLQSKTYRQLQHMAKSMSLPSNFKKVNLIELILAKKYKTDEDVVRIIHRVRQERLHLSKVNKKYREKKIKFQIHGIKHRISEARNSVCYSPPITVTPRRPSDIQLSPEIVPNAFVPMNPKRNLMRSITPNYRSNTAGLAVSSSDRVLRSFNLKTVKPNYALINNNIQEFKSQCCANTETKFKITPNGGINIKTKCYVRRSNNIVRNHPKSVLKPQFYITHGGDMIRAIVPAKRQRILSGIYPLQPEETIPRNLSTKQSVSLRKNDGSYTKINALVQKCNLPKKNNYNTKSPEITIQEIIDEMDANVAEDLKNSNNNYLNIRYPNISGVNPTSDSNSSGSYDQMIINDNHREKYSLSDMQPIDYEQRIREEQLRYQRLNMRKPLPNISDAFTRFSYVSRDVTQPIYVQVSSEGDSVPNYPLYENYSTMNTLLETVYNIKTNAPLQNVADTKCVFSTKTIPTAAELPAPAGQGGALNVTSPAPDNDQYPDVDIRIRNFLQLQPSRRHTDFSSSSSLDTMDTTASIPEMVEDALEIISQDGDYMERMGMSAHIQCVFCGWAGPTIMLECHIRKDHANSIHKEYKSEWNITYTLGSLVQCGVWLHRVVELDSVLYMLSAKYEDPGCFMATLCSLSAEPEPAEKMVSITLFNKITGEPFSWFGRIPLPPNSPYDTNPNCFKMDLAKLDLLPNSANLKLVNRELVTECPSKVVVGHPALNDIHIIVFIKIFN